MIYGTFFSDWAFIFGYLVQYRYKFLFLTQRLKKTASLSSYYRVPVSGVGGGGEGSLEA